MDPTKRMANRSFGCCYASMLLLNGWMLILLSVNNQSSVYAFSVQQQRHQRLPSPKSDNRWMGTFPGTVPIAILYNNNNNNNNRKDHLQHQAFRRNHIIVHSTTDPSNNNNNNCDDHDSNANSEKCSQPSTQVSAVASTSTKTSADVDDDFPISPLLLEPFLPAADPRYMLEGPVGQDDFVVSREGGPRAEELTNENLLRIVQLQCSDLEVNTLLWKCFGYRFMTMKQDDEEEVEETTTTTTGYWNNDLVFPKWKERYPQPPDFIGMQRIYSKEVDQASMRANQALVRSIPLEKKQSLKTHLMPLGFKGYKYNELTPNKTRRAQCTNWLLYYREELFGYTVEELKERRRRQEEEEIDEASKQQQQNTDGSNNEWKPPVRQVF